MKLSTTSLVIGLILSGAACTAPSGGGGGNDNASENDNASQNRNVNGNDNLPSNQNDNGAENDNDNTTQNQNDNAAGNQNDNDNGGGNDNAADNVNANDNAPAPQGLAPENQRFAFQSQCAQNVITCTTSFPEAVIGVGFLPGQIVTTTPAGLRIEGGDGDGVELVQLVGEGSTAGQGASEPPFFSWSFGADDPDPCTLMPGEEFSTDANPQVLMQAGAHYIRLTVRNDLPSEDVESDQCGTFEDYVRSDFEEIEIEVVD